MHWIPRDRLARDILGGTFLNLGSATATEIAASTGFDWLLIDLEHGSGTVADLRGQLLAAATRGVPAVVRVPSTDMDLVKFAMDSGAAGIMFPYIGSAAEAAQAVASVKYPPQGQRGVAGNIRAARFGPDWREYFLAANAASLVVVQIETPEAVAFSAEIAQVPGVDVLFVGPLDLSVNLDCPGDFRHELVIQAMKDVITACRQHGKTPGILSRPELVAQHLSLGFRFVALGSDIGAVQTGMQQNVTLLNEGRR